MILVNAFQATFRTVKDWVRELKRNCMADMVIAIAGNKSDLNDLREVRARGKNTKINSNLGSIFQLYNDMYGLLYAKVSN